MGWHTSLGDRDVYHMGGAVHLCTQLSRVRGHPTPPFRCGLLAPAAGAALTQPGVWGSAGLEQVTGVYDMFDGVSVMLLSAFPSPSSPSVAA